MDIFSAVRMVLERECPELELRTEEPMARHTTFRVGGPARLMAFPKDKKEIKAAVRAADQMGVVPFFLGNGSNLLVADKGVEAFVIKTGGLDQVREVNRRLRAECGIPLARLAMAALGRGLTGLEFAHGIPGSLGGAVVMNAGAYGGEMVQVLTAVTYLDEAGSDTLPAGACGLTYRHSLFSDHPEWLILEAEMALPQGDAEQIQGRMEELARKRRGQAAPGVPQRGQHLQAAGGPLCRRPHRAVRPEGCGHGRRPGVGEARRLCDQPGRRHRRRRAAADGPGAGDGAPGDRRGPGAGGPASGLLT